ncbi:hypothetical protein AVEN_33515-1 [Araneus ventricosus]|uniref:Uncharacterized protein n=1 Tax=Araneus ventricosus TaxID=182803 RepID=A0A4Y2GQZ1_ARAVE|nr:hypothetical protein AVEN_33515-1 [Araneus ventricosus]
MVPSLPTSEDVELLTTSAHMEGISSIGSIRLNLRRRKCKFVTTMTLPLTKILRRVPLPKQGKSWQNLQEHETDMQLQINQLLHLHHHYFMISATAQRALLIKTLENCHMPGGSKLPIDCFGFT